MSSSSRRFIAEAGPGKCGRVERVGNTGADPCRPRVGLRCDCGWEYGFEWVLESECVFDTEWETGWEYTDDGGDASKASPSSSPSSKARHTSLTSLISTSGATVPKSNEVTVIAPRNDGREVWFSCVFSAEIRLSDNDDVVESVNSDQSMSRDIIVVFWASLRDRGKMNVRN